MSIRQRQPTRIKSAPQGERKWEHEVTDTLNTLPQQSAFSYDTPEGNVPAPPGTWGSNIKDGATSMWVKASGDTETGWQSIATTGVYDVVSDLSQRIADRAIVEVYYTPSAVEFTTDDGNSGGIPEVTYWLDGEFIQVEEKAATPGFTTTFTISDVTLTPDSLFLAYKYGGTPSNHEVDIDIYDYDDEAWKTVTMVTSSNTVAQSLPLPDAARFVQNDQLQVRFNHADNGNASHYMRYEYISVHAETLVV